MEENAEKPLRSSLEISCFQDQSHHTYTFFLAARVAALFSSFCEARISSLKQPKYERKTFLNFSIDHSSTHPPTHPPTHSPQTTPTPTSLRLHAATLPTIPQRVPLLTVSGLASWSRMINFRNRFLVNFGEAPPPSPQKWRFPTANFQREARMLPAKMQPAVHQALLPGVQPVLRRIARCPLDRTPAIISS